MPTNIDAIVAAAEKSDRIAVSTLLNAENAYDRVGVAKLLQERVKQDRVTNSSLPTIELSTVTDFSKKELLLEIKANSQNAAAQKSLYSANLLKTNTRETTLSVRGRRRCTKRSIRATPQF